MKESSIVNDGAAMAADGMGVDWRECVEAFGRARKLASLGDTAFNGKTKSSYREAGSKYSCAGNLRIVQCAVRGRSTERECAIRDPEAIQRAQVPACGRYATGFRRGRGREEVIARAAFERSLFLSS